ncbi:NAD(P)-dependent oxidoreductase [Enteractinococcus helveticum]|uniref:Oxidoreductase n=1 Tax=Enteractinococcus helveticum TaxID=1837282 RepID=A0A1B7M2R0_9MICC|nr:NAD(P)-dependent oxidoreductase [Enteractinococcus helveticum]OAV62861.1 hypothetical protein A6F49_04160 [Enteractinococcus helveticum]
MKTPTIGVIGAGAMGFPIAENIAKARLSPLVVDANRDTVKTLATLGIRASEQIPDAWDSELIVICVASADQLESVYEALELNGTSRSRIALVLSTVGPEFLAQFASRVAPYGVRVVDCPMTGGVSGAKKGVLKFMCSGSDQDVQKVIDVLDGVIGSFVQVGTEPGQGQSVKLINNLLSSVHLVAAAEAVNLAETLGLDPANLSQILISGAGDSWMMRERYPRMALPAQEREFDTALAIFRKDTELISQTAKHVGAYSPLVHSAAAIFHEAAESAGLSVDDTYVADLYRQKTLNNGGQDA